MDTPKRQIQVLALIWMTLLCAATDGQQATVNCSASDFCSGCTLKFTLRWEGEDGSTTEFKNLTDVMQRENISSPFNASADHHNTEVTCEVTVKDRTAAESKTLNGIYNLLETWLENLKKTYVTLIIGVLIGILFSAIFFCLVIKCCRSKKKRSINLADDLEMVTAHTQMVDDGRIHDEGVVREAAESAGLLASDHNAEPKESEYSDIDFSAFKKKNSTDQLETQETKETEYAEIKPGAKMVTQEDCEESEVLEDKDEDQVMEYEGEEATERMKAENTVGEDGHLSSSVKDIVDMTVDG
ncbi:uncharacterized protein ACNS7B_018502 [Menidia menidia]